MIEVSKFIASDSDAIRRISIETGFAGSTLEGIIDNVKLFSDLSTHYIFNDKAGETFVARENGEPVGYIFIATEKRVYDRIQRNYYAKRITDEFANPHLFTKKDLKFYFWYAISFFKGEFSFPYHVEYPAVLHINVDASHQGMGIGKKLFTLLFEFLESRKCPGVQIQTTTANRKALIFFEKAGFTILHSKRSTLYRKYGYRDARNLLMVKSV